MTKKTSAMHTSRSVPLMARASSFTSITDAMSTSSDDETDSPVVVKQSLSATVGVTSRVAPRWAASTTAPRRKKKYGSKHVSTSKQNSSSLPFPFNHPLLFGEPSKGSSGIWSLSAGKFLRGARSVLVALWVFLMLGTILHFNFLGHDHDRNISNLRDNSIQDGTDVKKNFRPNNIRSAPVPVAPLFPSQRHIPLPVPPNKVSVVLMNYSRPRMIQESSLMRTLLAHANVDEVLLLHSNPKTAFEFVHQKVKNIDATSHNDQMGLSLRFYFSQLAKNEWVIHVDDDMEFSTATLSELLVEFGKNPKRIVGRFGRNLSEGNSFNGYNSRNSHKSSEVVLTKFMIMERKLCTAFFHYADAIWDDLVLNSGEGPLWNGEDIFMSLVANHVYGMPEDGFNNYAMDWLDVWSASDDLKDYDNGKLDISGGMAGYKVWDWHWWQSLLRRNRHYSYRGTLWHTARERLSNWTNSGGKEFQPEDEPTEP
mmetsp:Transcript_15037/g.27266  ORF Transcript_15037/g.27266 Transcript_15037/m.27266 type:complete len:481 (-) Transcript_15037:118-1560(-)